MKLLLAVILALTFSTAQADEIEVITFVRWGSLVVELSPVETLDSEPATRRYAAFTATELLSDFSQNEDASQDRIDAYFASEKMGKWSRQGEDIILYDLQDNILHTVPASNMEYKVYERHNSAIRRGKDLG